MIQEQNSIPGLITRKLSRKTNKILLGFKEAEKKTRWKLCFHR